MYGQVAYGEVPYGAELEGETEVTVTPNVPAMTMVAANSSWDNIVPGSGSRSKIRRRVQMFKKQKRRV